MLGYSEGPVPAREELLLGLIELDVDVDEHVVQPHLPRVKSRPRIICHGEARRRRACALSAGARTHQPVPVRARA
jgi:hypothetical protein